MFQNSSKRLQMKVEKVILRSGYIGFPLLQAPIDSKTLFGLKSTIRQKDHLMTQLALPTTPTSFPSPSLPADSMHSLQ
jgi:hypothetical protein